MDAAQTAAPGPRTAAPIPLLPVDERLLGAPPVLALLRLDGAADPAAVRRAFLAHVPARLAAAVADGPDGVELRPDPARVGWGVAELPAGGIDRFLGVNVPLGELAAIGLGDAPARDPLCTLTHLRCPDGDALALRVSHAAGDGISVISMLGRIVAELARGPRERRPAGARPDERERSGGAAGSTGGTAGSSAGSDPDAGSPVAIEPTARTTADGPRWLSVLPLSPACRAEIAAVSSADTGASPTVCRMAVVARRLAPLVLPAGEGLRIRIPVDLRHRGLGIPADAVGNHWFDALAVLDGPHEELPPAAELAATIARTIRERVAELSPADIDHRHDQSLRLTREVPGEPIRRGVDLVHSSLPTPAWPGVRALHVLGSANLGVVDQRGADRVDVVTPRPLPAGVVAL